MQHRSRRLLVVGGGIGGMAAAAALAQHGMDVVLIEKRHEFSVPGVGLGQPANALRVFRWLGVLDQVLEAGFAYDCMRFFDHDRVLIAEHRFGLGGDGIPAVCALSRSDLHGILLAAARGAGVDIRLGTTIESIDENGADTEVTFADGSTDAFEVVIGFDGIRSTTRLFAFGGAFEPTPSGFGAWRIQVPRPVQVDAMEFYQGIGSKTGAMPLRDDMMYLFHIRPEPPGLQIAADAQAAMFRERLTGYGSYIADIRNALRDGDDIVYSPLEPSLLPPPWHRGRIVLGGDAAHAFPPHLTEGAAMALEDGVVLAQELAKDLEVEQALCNYTERRYARCAFVYTFAMQMLHSEQSVHTRSDLLVARSDIAAYGSTRMSAADRVLDTISI